VRFAFTRADLVVGAGCCVLVAVLVVVLGIGVGMRRSADLPRAVSPSVDNGAFEKRT
jgi:hypothetical protein